MKVLICDKWVDCKDVPDEAPAKSGLLKFTKAIPVETADWLTAWYLEGMEIGPKNATKMIPFGGHIFGLYHSCFVFGISHNNKGLFEVVYGERKQQ